MTELYDNKYILKQISYNVHYPYIGSFTPHELSSAYWLHHTDEMQDAKMLRVGNIDGNVICNALWREMSRNPVRFGDSSPFVFNGRNNIYAFCSSAHYCVSDGDTAGVLYAIRHNLIGYMTLNALPNGQWNARLDTKDGVVYIGTNKNYAMLAKLRECIKIIARRNVADFKNKKGPYRNGIVSKLYGVNLAPDEDDALDRQREFLDTITEEHGIEMYAQARAEKERFLGGDGYER